MAIPMKAHLKPQIDSKGAALCIWDRVQYNVRLLLLAAFKCETKDWIHDWLCIRSRASICGQWVGGQAPSEGKECSAA